MPFPARLDSSRDMAAFVRQARTLRKEWVIQLSLGRRLIGLIPAGVSKESVLPQLCPQNTAVGRRLIFQVAVM